MIYPFGKFWLLYTALVMICAAFAVHAYADPTYWLDAMIASQHFPDRGFNQSNPGLGVEMDSGNWQFAVGEYKNSYYRHTNYATVGYLPVHIGGWSAGIVGGPATGYAFPVLGGVEVTYRATSWGINFLGVPPVMKGSAVIAIQLVVRLP